MAKSTNMRIIISAVDKTAKTTSGLLGRLSRMARSVAPYVAAASAVAGATAAAVNHLDKLAEAELTANARIEQVARSMGLFGNQASDVAKRLADLADKQAINLGIDDDTIKLTQAKLLTFANLAKTADETGGMFDRATQAALDLAAAGFGTAEQNAVQLGKALQDPIKGITALARSGVTFTDSEKERIRVLVQSGKIAEAQRVVMSAIEKQVGGVAQATANASDKVKVAWNEFKESIGLKLHPVVEKARLSLAGFLAQLASGKHPAWLDALLPRLKPLGDALMRSFATLKQSMGPALDSLKNAFEALRPFLEQVVKGIGIIVGMLVTVFVGGVNGIVRAIGPLLRAIGGIVAVVANVFNLIVGLLTGNKAKVRRAVEGIKRGIVDVFAGLWGAIKGFFTGFIDGAVGFLKAAVPNIGKAAEGIVEGIKRGITNAWGKLIEWFRAKVRTLVTGFTDWLDIRSPSRVFERLASQIPAGIVSGIASGAPAVAAAVNGLVPVPAYGGAARSFAASSGRQELHVYIDGRELDRVIVRRESLRSRTGVW